VIRTLSTFSINKDYRYVVQPGLTYQGFLERKWMKHVHRMIPRRKLEGPDDIELLVYATTPEEIEARRAKHSARAKRGKRAKKGE
jgi:hypothetical protein